MRTVEITPSALTSASASIADGPVFMVNLLRYKERADYADKADMAGKTGREAYFEHYVPAFRAVAAAEGVDVFYLGAVMSSVVAPDGERWDDVAIVRYPSFAAFRRIVESPEYLETAAHHRKAALDDWRLIATNKMS
jgi:hypothetical protein